jgi:glycosyltransferase involved in cell wall biosynthesis
MQQGEGNVAAAKTRLGMLLDNHYRPDPRVGFEIELLSRAGIAVRVVAWDRRVSAVYKNDEEMPDVRLIEPGMEDEPDLGTGGTTSEVVRITAPTPGYNRRLSSAALLKFSRCVWRDRRRLFRGCHALVVHDIYLLPFGWLLARELKVPFIYDAHEDFAVEEACRYPAWFLRLAMAVETRLARDAFAVVVPGRPRLPRWSKLVHRPLILLPNFVHCEQCQVSSDPVEWDLVCAGTLSETRRLDLLIDLARQRPDLRIAVAGRGHRSTEVADAATELPNLSYLGWRKDVDSVLARGRSIYYGRDPEDSYSEVACPNTLYQALRHRKPLIFLCGGEVAEIAEEFNIGIRPAATAAALSEAVDHVASVHEWEFDAAWSAVWQRANIERWLTTIADALGITLPATSRPLPP